MTVWIEAPFDSLPIEGYRKQRYWMMAEAFVRAGHRVVYWTSDFNHATKKKREMKGECGRRDFRLVQIPTQPYPANVCLKRLLSHRAYARTWKRLAEEAVGGGEPNPDVILVSSPPTSTGRVGLSLARRWRAKFVVDVQDAWPETFYRLLPRGFRWVGPFLFAHLRREVGVACRAADLVTGVCDRYASLVAGYGARAYYRAYLGIDVSDSVPCRRDEGDPMSVRLVYVGNLGVSYDLKTVIEGVRLLNRGGTCVVTLDVAGFGGMIDGDAVVRFHGMLGRAELRALLSRCDIGIIPMKADSFVGIPNKLAEYAAAGLKIVSSLQGETAELLVRYGCGATYRPGDAADFVAAVERVRTLPTNASARLVSEELSADRIYDAYCKRICAL